MTTLETPVPQARPRRSHRAWGDAVFLRATEAAGASVLLLVAVLFAAMVAGAWPALRQFGPAFFTGRTWDPVADHYGALPYLWGTLVSSLLALVIAVPVSVGTAIFLAELAPARLRAPLSFLVELLAAVPSVVYGLWGVLVMVPW